jgi:hypothetical protein
MYAAEGFCMTFHVGAKIVCVDDSDPRDKRCVPGGFWVPNWPARDVVYTIRGFTEIGSVYLEEIKNPIRYFFGGPAEAAFMPSRFRPIVSRKTDISIFTKMLTPQGVDA